MNTFDHRIDALATRWCERWLTAADADEAHACSMEFFHSFADISAQDAYCWLSEQDFFLKTDVSLSETYLESRLDIIIKYTKRLCKNHTRHRFRHIRNRLIKDAKSLVEVTYNERLMQMIVLTADAGHA